MSLISCLTSKAKRLTLIAIFLLLLATSYLLLANNPVHAGECNVDTRISAKEAVDQINKCAIEKNVFDDKIFNLNQIAGTADSLYNMLTGESTLHEDTNSVTQKSGALAASSNLVEFVSS